MVVVVVVDVEMVLVVLVVLVVTVVALVVVGWRGVVTRSQGCPVASWANPFMH